MIEIEDKDHAFLDQIQEVGYLQIVQIINVRQPLGKYWARYGLIIVAVDNTTGDAWTENFGTVEEAMIWLNDPWSDPLDLLPGDWVIYTNGARKEVGVVKRKNAARPPECCPTSYFVWYHEGDTAACTPASTLQRIDSPGSFINIVKNAYAIPELTKKREEIQNESKTHHHS